MATGGDDGSNPDGFGWRSWFPGSNEGRDKARKILRSTPEGAVGREVLANIDAALPEGLPSPLRNAASQGYEQFVINEMELARSPATPENLTKWANKEGPHFGSSPQLTQRIVGGQLTNEQRARLLIEGIGRSPSQRRSMIYRSAKAYPYGLGAMGLFIGCGIYLFGKFGGPWGGRGPDPGSGGGGTTV